MFGDQEDHLEAALRRIAAAEMRVEQQEALIERLMAAGCDAFAAQETLDLLRHSLGLFKANYRALLRIAAPPAASCAASADKSHRPFLRTHAGTF